MNNLVFVKHTIKAQKSFSDSFLSHIMRQQICCSVKLKNIGE